MLKSLEELVKIIRERKHSNPEKSYTSKLLNDRKMNFTKNNKMKKKGLNYYFEIKSNLRLVVIVQ